MHNFSIFKSYSLVRWTPPFNPLLKVPFPLPPARICAFRTISFASVKEKIVLSYHVPFTELVILSLKSISRLDCLKAIRSSNNKRKLSSPFVKPPGKKKNKSDVEE